MKIEFTRKNAPLHVINKETGDYVGTIKPVYRQVPTDGCTTCGHSTKYKEVIRGYSLMIHGRYWGNDGNLRPQGRGGCTSEYFKRLSWAKKVVQEVLA